MRIKGSYGVDAPYAPVLSFIGGVLLLVLFAGSSGLSKWIGVIFGILLLGQTALYLHTTLRGKFIIWNRLVRQLDLRGDERVLDVGCGRGMTLIEVALLLPQGQAVGIDLWRSRDQSGNDPQTTMRNARENGVDGLIELHTGDMTQMPFATGSFHVVISNVAIQNIKDRQRRRLAIAEIYRVTKPGGRIRIVDIQYLRSYQDDLIALGAEHVSIRGLGPLGWFGNPLYASKLVSAYKPPEPAQPPAG